MLRKTYVDGLHPPPSKKRKNSPKLKDCQVFFNVIRVLGYSNTGVR